MSSFSFPFLLRSWKQFLFAAFLGGLLSLLFSFLTPLQYASTVRLLVTQVNTTGLDPYTAAKSTERIAANLAELVHSSTFAVNAAGRAQGFDASYFPDDEYERRQLWARSVETAVIPGTGIMEISAYHPRRDQARVLAEAISQEIAVQGPNYFGYNIRAQVIDPPLDSKWFARPRVLENGLVGVLLGLALGVIWRLAKIGRRKSEQL
jgi:uncharacterized protein involved in exopolysaccharide biosynthesis